MNIKLIGLGVLGLGALALASGGGGGGVKQVKLTKGVYYYGQGRLPLSMPDANVAAFKASLERQGRTVVVQEPFEGSRAFTMHWTPETDDIEYTGRTVDTAYGPFYLDIIAPAHS